MTKVILERGFLLVSAVFAVSTAGWRGLVLYLGGLMLGYAILARPEFERMQAVAIEAQEIATRAIGRLQQLNPQEEQDNQ